MKKNRVPKIEEEEPPNTKIRIVVTIDDKLVSEVKTIHEKEIRIAEEQDRVEPDWSNTVEMLLRKGVKPINLVLLRSFFCLRGFRHNKFRQIAYRIPRLCCRGWHC